LTEQLQVDPIESGEVAAILFARGKYYDDNGARAEIFGLAAGLVNNGYHLL
jgi:lipoprotein NlpI